ncbi:MULTISPECIES: DedA family protein [unclassified Phyllobacterium]|uniref:DedA family protein n=1 Tax=unclassified Phyllobacterium TaxID=2638441 RepID=UPI000488CBB0|nr:MULTISPECIES: DedA family protein [unclassified Phyllobacterium]SFJ48771.1 membrane protein DedA, SNARE-associated domain [Phyllobacterium sp. CL33Tsu]
MQFLTDGTAFLEPYIRQYGLYAIFVIIYLESFGAPLPGESALVAAALLATRGDFAIIELFLAVWVAAVIGDSTGYAIGHFGGRPLLRRYGWIVRLTPERQRSLEELFEKRGPIIVFGARFVVILRQLNGLVAGSVGMHFGRFLIANALGGLLWASVWTFGPYFLGDAFMQWRHWVGWA